MATRRRGARYWIWRYLPGEVAGTVGAIGGAWLTYRATGSLAAAAVVGTLAEGVGFYAVCVARTLAAELRAGRDRSTRSVPAHLARAMLRTAALTVAEFGPAEAVDTLLVRPGLLYLAPQLVDSALLGWTVGKLAADVVFYSVAGVSHLLTVRAAGVVEAGASEAQRAAARRPVEDNPPARTRP